MKLKIGNAYELISEMKTYFQLSAFDKDELTDAPLLEELFSSDKMDQHGKSLAEFHRLADVAVPGQLLPRLDDNEKTLNEARKILVESIRENRFITPASEWLIDNFYLIEEQIRTARKHLPKGYSEKLPQLIQTTTPGLTRVYDVVLQLISHSDGRVDLDRLSNFIRSYQSVKPLQLGELWAIPIMLRLTLIENLRRVSAVIAINRINTNLADYWCKQMLEMAEIDSKSLILLTADMARSNPPMVSAFVSEMFRQLLGKGPHLAIALNWIEQRLTESGKSSSELIAEEIQKQGINQASVSNSIGSLRLLSTLDWRDFVELHSVVEQTLRKDEVYVQMDFSTRDSYRHVVESLAKSSKLSENQIATLALDLASENKTPAEGRKSHVGYYLVAEGLAITKRRAGITLPLVAAMIKRLGNNRLLAYISAIIFITTLVSSFLLSLASTTHASYSLLLLVVIILLLCSSQLAVSVVNFFSTLLVRPKLLPRMDFSASVPDEYSTLTVIPTLLTDLRSIEDMVEALEVRFLANRDPNLHFCLLTDFKDAPSSTMPDDQGLLLLAEKKIRQLKFKYEHGDNELFFLFHRPRRWNIAEKVWMGYERKRGKLNDLNGLLRGNSAGRFSFIVGDHTKLMRVKYIITLDTDTQLPRGAAWKMIATLAHPLNRAVYNEQKKRITEGYGILQPRVTVSLPESNSSFYTRLHGNEPGIDPYTRATSDVYQDLFEEGSFIGKGIYDIDAFEQTLIGRFGDNSILSHDLLEGCYVRSGLLSDVELHEKYPVSYQSDMKRRSRWIRGDWQIFSWFLAFVPGVDGHFHRNPLSALSRWKIFDNIRRSLVPIALTLLIILGWTLLNAPLFWTITVSAVIVFPIFLTLFWESIKKPEDIIWSHHFSILLHTAGNVVVQTLFSVICLPFEAYSGFTAIARTIWRMLISRKNLLEWNTSSNTDRIVSSTLWGSYKFMWIAPTLSFTLLIILTLFAPLSLFIAAPVLLLWGISPVITWLASKARTKQKTVLTGEQIIFLRRLARKTWGFFERFVGVADNWLPPDNFQQHPAAVLAHRTSPTNIGLSLLANLSAHDFGYISTAGLLERTAGTLQTLKGMERYNGHFYNWYDTISLQPLLPKYISTVDSGNLAGHLLTLRQGLFEILHRKMGGNKIFQGLKDTTDVLNETLDTAQLRHVSAFTAMVEKSCTEQPETIDDTMAVLQRLSESYNIVEVQLQAAPGSVTEWWQAALSGQLQQAVEEIQLLSPWFMYSNAPQKFSSVIEIDKNITLNGLSSRLSEIIPQFHHFKDKGSHTVDEINWLEGFIIAAEQSKTAIDARIDLIKRLGHDCIHLADMDLDFLYDKSKHLLSIGYKVAEHVRDPGYYDLLASEARLCTFVGIAQGKLPEDSWFALGRLLTKPDGAPILLSWSGSMFEYLMPLLVMPTYENTLLDQTYRSSVQRQIKYAKQRGIPWGISESAYNAVDTNSNYQYRAFGVPGLGLKRGLELDLVIAPYATVLALMVAPELSCQNLMVLSEEGFAGTYGFYEAIDYTTSRLPQGQSCTVIKSFMAHHQGMSLLSLSYLLLGKPMQRRFEAEPQFQATLLLLQERIPKASSFYAHTTDIEDMDYAATEATVRTLYTPYTPVPEVQLLSNGRYHVMVTNSGGGYSKWKDIAVTRWHEDSTRDNWGAFCYIRDLATGEYWSNAFQPVLKKGEDYEVTFSQGRVDIINTYSGIEAHTEIVISPEDDIEIRRLKITNRSDIRRTIEITSYAEVVLATPASDAMQPAFSNLFVQTAILPLKRSIICSRRPRSAADHAPWMFHSMILHGGHQPEEISYETDRMQFLGHGNTSAAPRAMKLGGPLSNTHGSVLDPVIAIRYKIILEPDDHVSLDLITGIGVTQTICESLIDKYQDKHHKDRVFELAWTHSQVILRQINASESDAQLFGSLAGSVVFANPALRAIPSVIMKNNRKQSDLWGYSISGDLPIILLQIKNREHIDLAVQLIRAHTYWRHKGLLADLVIWNEDYGDYRQVLQNQIQALVPSEWVDRPGGVFLKAADHISTEDRTLFQTVARINISDERGTLSDQISRKGYLTSKIPYIKLLPAPVAEAKMVSLPDGLHFFNGLGGFSANGKEYIIRTDNDRRPPAPWVNVIANAEFGTVVSENGQCYTWTENAHEMRLTPWHNDPVTDAAGEAFFLRDEETGRYWSVTQLPRGGSSAYITRHGFGYSVIEHIEDGIHSEMTIYVDLNYPIKFISIKVRNDSGRPRRLSATGYAEWVLGAVRAKTALYIVTERDEDTGAFFARNPYSMDFAGRIAFFDTDSPNQTFTGDRTEFIGRNGSLESPDAMSRVKLSGKMGMGLDPCAVIQIPFQLASGEETEIIFRLGAGKNIAEARNTVRLFRGQDAAKDALEKVHRYWEHTTSYIEIDTPDLALNIIANGWLVYQSLSCRLWGRSAFYQSGGAFGFRDQLQDATSLFHVAPGLARKQILLSASRQFKEGDVQHWWHPPAGAGVRTHISDDYLWLPWVTSKYLANTGDMEILDEESYFLEGRKLLSGEESYYDLPAQSEQKASLYGHCVMAIRNGLKFGVHGLPLIGSGDWNDGMDRVGHLGKGESVWLGFFLYDVLMQFIPVANGHNDPDFAALCEKEATQLALNLEQHGWDGNWYLRAYFDDGTPVGSAINDECQIDSIAQSWAVLSGAGEKERAAHAMEAVYARLVKKDTALIALLDPPFDKTEKDPGYIKGYVPGVRENGGQYTHAAIWVVMAFARLGNSDRAWELLQMINPINHGRSEEEVATYKIEPYVVAGDVYAVAPHAGRGGWSWYTGSAGWMYQLITDHFLGLQKQGNKLFFSPTIPITWQSFTVRYRYGNTCYNIRVQQKNYPGTVIVTSDGISQHDNWINLIDDGSEHDVEVTVYSPVSNN